MTPKHGQFFASRSNSFIGQGIQKAEKIREKRINSYKKGDILWNHIGMFVEKDGVLYVAEALAEGFKIHPYIDSDYEKRKTEHCILELYRPWTETELIQFGALVWSFEDTPYDFEGIADSLDFCMTGVWKGKKGQAATDKMFCSEIAETIVNMIRKGIFPMPWCGNPQMFIENPNIKIVRYEQKIK